MFNSVSIPTTTATTTAKAAITATTGETSRIRSFMGRSTPAIGVLKTKFLTVLGNSNELLNGISSRLTLNISSSDSDYCDDDDDDDEELPKFDESIDYTKIDYESRRVKARRAHEEIISGRYRQPNLAPRPRLDVLHTKRHEKVRSSSTASSSSSTSTSTSSRSFLHNGDEKTQISSTTMSDSLESRHSGGYERARAIPGARRSELDMQRDVMRLNETIQVINTPHIEVQTPHHHHHSRDVVFKKQQQQQQQKHIQQSNIMPDNVGSGGIGGIGGGDGIGNGDYTAAVATTQSISNHSMHIPINSRRKNSNSSTLTSLRDDPDIQSDIPSLELTDWCNFIRSESQNSVPSWASSISLDCRTGEEPVKDFMKRFTQHLFYNTNAIDVELKTEFGTMIHMEIGRQWFGRFLIEQRNKFTRVDELTFHSLVQYFAIVLFECKECEDYPNATIIMNLCFVFYREVEVPGCEPYREYLFTYIREQPIWLNARFWTLAFCNTLQQERERRLAAHQKKLQRRQAKDAIKSQDVKLKDKSTMNGSSQSIESKKIKVQNSNKVELKAHDFDKEMENIAFHHLGAFTCNIHALGVPQEVCLEFFKKSINGLNLPKDKIKLIRENIQRMYYETDLWGAKQS